MPELASALPLKAERTRPVAGDAGAIRASLRQVGEVRLQIGRALVAAGLAPVVAGETTERWLLAALAAEELALGGTLDALRAASAGQFAAMAGLVQAVERATGLRLELASLPGESSRSWKGEPFDAFVVLRKHDDPFGLLGQELRGLHLAGTAGALALHSSEARRNEGGYYTPFKLAQRLTEQALDGLEPEANRAPSVIDPACGAGTFLAAAFDVLWRRLEHRRRATPDVPIEPVAWAIAALHGIDVDRTALWTARLSLSVRAAKAERTTSGAGQLALFGQTATYGPLIADRIRLGDALGAAPAPTASGTERLRLRLLARDEPGRLPAGSSAAPVVWDTAFPLRFADDEGAFTGSGGFDLVLTNPPFVPVDRISAERREQLKTGLHTMQRRFDLFIGFVERARTLLTPGGRAALLIPRTFLTESNAEKCRHLLLESACIERIEDLGRLKFDQANIDCVMLTFLARRPVETTAVEIAHKASKHPAAVLQSAFRRLPRGMFRMELAEPAAEECLRVAAHSVPLGRFFCASWGARGSPVKDFHLDAPSHPLAKPMVKGDDVEPFKVRAATRWLLYDVDRLYRPSMPAFFEREKIVVRKVAGARGLVCAIDREGYYTDDSVACVVRKGDLASLPLAERRRHRIKVAPSQIEVSRRYELDLLSALLQTPLVQTYYRVQLGGGLNVFPELIESLPLPQPDDLDRPEARELAALGRVAREGAPFDSITADFLARRLFHLA